MHGIDEKELYAVKVSETIIDVLATYWSYILVIQHKTLNNQRKEYEIVYIP